MTPLDHDELVRLYCTDPYEFCRVTQKMIDDFIKSIPNDISRFQCRGLQHRIEGELKNYKDPIARMNRMVELFWEGVSKFSAVLNEEPVDVHEQPTAKIIPFKKKE